MRSSALTLFSPLVNYGVLKVMIYNNPDHTSYATHPKISNSELKTFGTMNMIVTVTGLEHFIVQETSLSFCATGLYGVLHALCFHRQAKIGFSRLGDSPSALQVRNTHS